MHKRILNCSLPLHMMPLNPAPNLYYICFTDICLYFLSYAWLFFKFSFFVSLFFLI